MSYTGKEAVFQLSAILAGKGVEYAILSPGSRNAPLIAAFERQAGIQCLSVVDERSAAFFALGIAQQTRKPVAVVCTSGTAALNYSPAIAEAYYQEIPLIIITADRPQEWIDQGDGQAIRQTRLYEPFIRRAVQLPTEPRTLNELRYSARLVHEAIDASVFPVFGPVHINVPLQDPLYQGYPSDPLPDSNIDLLSVETIPDPWALQKLASAWNQAKSKLIIVGQHFPCIRINALMEELSEDPSLAIFTETTSNLQGSMFFSHIDRLIDGMDPLMAESFSPEIVLGLGGHIVSRKVKAWLQKHPPKAHWQVSPSGQHMDPFRALTMSIPSQVFPFLKAFVPLASKTSSDYHASWVQHAEKRRQRHAQYLSQVPWSDLKAFQTILPQIPAGTVIQAGNSTPVRYLQLFDQVAGTSCYGNRGTSGIDGCMSTAAGAAWANPSLMLLITGDLAFLYDSNALWNQHLSPNLRIIVINNGGGNIFRIIEGPDTLPELDPYIETPYVPALHHLAEMYNLDFYRSTDEESLKKALPQFLHPRTSRPAILEVKTPNKLSAAVLRDYFKFLSL